MAAPLLEWPIPAELESDPQVKYRNDYGVYLSTLSADQIAPRYVYHTPEQMAHLLECARRVTNAPAFIGDGIELGAGCALLSSVVALQPSVTRIFAVEVCREFPRLVMPKIADLVLGTHRDKIVPVAGSFDDIQLKSESLSFAVEIDSLHHSPDLVRTLTELKRVLKPGGVALFLDRSHPDTTTDEEIEAMLSIVYSEDFLRANHYPPGIRLTRRENGEHEFRHREWADAFEKSGFLLKRSAEIKQKITFRQAGKGVLSPFRAFLPGSIRRSTKNSSIRDTAKYLSQTISFGSDQELSSKECSVFLLEKA